MTCLGLSDRTRGDDVRCHSAWTILDGHGVRQRVDASLGNRHMGLEWHAAIVQGGADKDDAPARATGAGLNWTASAVALSVMDTEDVRDLESILCF